MANVIKIIIPGVNNFYKKTGIFIIFILPSFLSEIFNNTVSFRRFQNTSDGVPMPDNERVDRSTENNLVKIGTGTINAETGNADAAEDSSVTREDAGVNLLREKTFTEELRSLIDQVTRPGDHEPLEQRLDQLTEEEVIYHLHKIFYQTINLVNLDKVNSCFNPFDYGSGIHEDTIIRAVYDEMDRLDMSHFALLPYHLNKKCFMPTINHITALDMTNLYIDPSDHLYNGTIESAEGIMIIPGLINDDPLLKKRFIPGNALEENYYYLNTLKNIHRGLSAEVLALQEGYVMDAGFSPLLLIELDRKKYQDDPRQVYFKIARNLQVILLLYSNMEYMKIRSVENKGFRQYIKSMEYFFQYIMKNKGGRCYIIRFNRYYQKQTFYLKSYLITKIRTALTWKSMLLNLDESRVIVVADTYDIAPMEKLVQELKEGLEKEIQCEIIEEPARNGFYSFLENVVFK